MKPSLELAVRGSKSFPLKERIVARVIIHDATRLLT